MITINPAQEAKKITSFLQHTFAQQGITHAVLGLSGGIDSTTSLFLLKDVLPKDHISVMYMPYFPQDTTPIAEIVKKAGIPQFHIISIKDMVDSTKKALSLASPDTVRLGNIMARMRMITLFDMAKKEKALVVGTENKSEYHLAYFTRFGDEAADIEPIQHLYKTHVYQLAAYLGVPQFVLDAKPTAGLWEGQTDENEFGFTYQEADEVMHEYFDQKSPIEIIKKQFPNAEKIIQWCKKNEFKHHVPYTL